MRVFILLCLLGWISCSDQKAEKKGTVVTHVSPSAPVDKAGSLLSFQPCSLDANLHFSVYYPAQFKAKQKFPILILFDPHGDPDLPLEKYKSLADEYDFILIASKESKNGNGPEQTSNIVQTLLYQNILIE